MWRAARDLMDQAIDRDTERDIIALAESHPYVERVEQCLSRMAGGRYIVDLDVVFRSGDLSLIIGLPLASGQRACRND